MYIIRPPPMSTRLAKDSARAVVASEQESAIRASNFTTRCFMVVRLSPSSRCFVGYGSLADIAAAVRVSALPPKADLTEHRQRVRLAPKTGRDRWVSPLLPA